LALVMKTSGERVTSNANFSSNVFRAFVKAAAKVAMKRHAGAVRKKGDWRRKPKRCKGHGGLINRQERGERTEA